MTKNQSEYNSITGSMQTQAKVIDMNLATNFALNTNRKKNKNDFYRFLLQQNFGDEGEDVLNQVYTKVNNDILIPRSNLKNGPQREKYKNVFDELVVGSGAEEVAPNEAVIGRKLKPDGQFLSPRTFNQNWLEN